MGQVCRLLIVPYLSADQFQLPWYTGCWRRTGYMDMLCGCNSIRPHRDSHFCRVFVATPPVCIDRYVSDFSGFVEYADVCLISECPG